MSWYENTTVGQGKIWSGQEFEIQCMPVVAWTLQLEFLFNITAHYLAKRTKRLADEPDWAQGEIKYRGILRTWYQADIRTTGRINWSIHGAHRAGLYIFICIKINHPIFLIMPNHNHSLRYSFTVHYIMMELKHRGHEIISLFEFCSGNDINFSANKIIS